MCLLFSVWICWFGFYACWVLHCIGLFDFAVSFNWVVYCLIALLGLVSLWLFIWGLQWFDICWFAACVVGLQMAAVICLLWFVVVVGWWFWL